jgi:hypothetical protein
MNSILLTNTFLMKSFLHHPMLRLQHLLCIFFLFITALNTANAQPDLVVLQDVIKSTLVYEQRNFSDQCLMNEKCIGGLGAREILRFTTEIRNIGTTDYFIGKAPIDPLMVHSQFIWDECHRHWHFKAYAKYGLYDAVSGKEMPTSFKNGFCVEDLGKFVTTAVPKYTCDNQGITAGCYDKYDLNLPCQWIDITGIAAGTYKLVVDVNWMKQKDNNGRDELDYNNNTATVYFKVQRAGATTTVTVTDGGVVPPSRTGVVTVYETKDYAGNVLSLNQGTYNATDLGALNLNISALTVMNGFQVRACRADGYCRIYTANTPFVGTDMDNKIVSLEVSEKPTPTNCTLTATPSLVPATCAGNDGRVTLTTNGGKSPYQASIDGAATFSTTLVFGGLTPGAHYVNVRDSVGCIIRKDFTIVKNCTPPANCDNILVNMSIIPATCSGNDGILDKLILGGVAPYQFSIDGKAPQNEPSFADLTVGAHYVTVKDKAGCNVRKDFTVTKNCPPPCTLDITAQPTNATCAANDGKVTIAEIGGTAPFHYAIDGKPSQTSNIFSGLTLGSHVVLVADKNNCIDNVHFTISKTCSPPLICSLVATAKMTNTTCIGTDGKVIITLVGGIAPFTYSIDGKPVQTTNTFIDLKVGNHTVIVKDKNSCTDDIVFTIGKTCCTLDATAQPTNATCVANDGKVTIAQVGGTAPFNYAIDGKPAQATNIFLALAVGSHTVVVTDKNDCKDNVQFNIAKTCTPPPTCNLVATAKATNTTCLGTDGKAIITLVGGTAPFTYTIDGKPATTNTFIDLKVGNHTVIVKDKNNCTDDVAFTIGKTCCTLDATAQPTNATCAANDGKVTIAQVGGTAPFNYAIDGKPAQATNTFSALSVGSHTVVVTDKNDCRDNIQFNIAKNCTPTPCKLIALAKATDATCAGNDGKATIIILGGTAPFTYTLDGKTVPTINDFVKMTVGNHKIIVKDKNGCVEEMVVTVGKNCCTLDADAQPTNATCAANDGKVTIITTGGTAPFTYILDGKPAQTTNVFEHLTVGSHALIVKDKNNCVDNTTFTIVKTCTPPPCTLNATAKATNATCAGNDGKAILTIVGGTAPFTYTLDGKTVPTINDFVKMTVGNHKIIVKDKNGCVEEMVVTVGKNCCTLDADAQPTNATCAANDGKVTIITTGGTTPFIYILDGKPAQTTNIFEHLTVGSHALIVKDKNNCVDNTTFTIAKTCTPPCTLNATAKANNATCAGNDGKAILTIAGGTAPFTYTLDGKTVPTINDFVKLTVGNHKIIVKDKNGCTDEVIVAIGKNCCTLAATTKITNVTCNGNDGKVTVLTVTGGIAPFTYAIDGKPAQTNTNFTALAVGSHKINVKDNAGCIYNTTFNIGTICEPVSFDPNKCYRLVFSHSGKVLDVPWSSKGNSYLHQWTWSNQPSQMWKIQKLSNGYYKIINSNSGKALDVAGWKETNGSPIVQWEYWDNTNVHNINQQWKIEKEAGIYQIYSRFTGKVLNLEGTLSKEDGARLNQWTNIDGLGDQRFKIEEVTCINNNEYAHYGYNSYGYRNSNEVDARFTIHPNPSRGQVHITLDAHFAEQLKKICVHDVTGSIVMETDTRSEEISFEILKDGFYIVALHTNNGSIVTRKLVVSSQGE